MMHILVIEDDPQFLRLLSRILRSAGHTVDEAPNGRLGVALCRQKLPDLVITDLIMPEQEGIETIRELRQAAPAIRILAISGSFEPAFLKAATALGATAGLAKPFSSDELLTAVDNLTSSADRQ